MKKLFAVSVCTTLLFSSSSGEANEQCKNTSANPGQEVTQTTSGIMEVCRAVGKPDALSHYCCNHATACQASSAPACSAGNQFCKGDIQNIPYQERKSLCDQFLPGLKNRKIFIYTNFTPDNPHGGGVVTFYSTLIKSLSERGIDADLLVKDFPVQQFLLYHYDKKQGTLVKDESKTISAGKDENPKGFDLARAERGLDKLFRDNPNSLVHSNTWRFGHLGDIDLASRLEEKRIPYVYTEHNPIAINTPGLEPSITDRGKFLKNPTYVANPKTLEGQRIHGTEAIYFPTDGSLKLGFSERASVGGMTPSDHRAPASLGSFSVPAVEAKAPSVGRYVGVSRGQMGELGDFLKFSERKKAHLEDKHVIENGTDFTDVIRKIESTPSLKTRVENQSEYLKTACVEQFRKGNPNQKERFDKSRFVLVGAIHGDVKDDPKGGLTTLLGADKLTKENIRSGGKIPCVVYFGNARAGYFEKADELRLKDGKKQPIAPHVDLGLVKDRVQYGTWLKSLDMYSSPSSFDSFGLVFVEAMAAGIPVISPKEGAAGGLFRGISEQAQPQNAGDVARAMKATLMMTPEQKAARIEAAKKEVETRWSADAMAERYMLLYARQFQAADCQAHPSESD